MNKPIVPGFSSPIDFRRLAHESRRLLCLGFLFAVLFHAALAVYMPYRQTAPGRSGPQEIPRIVRTDIIEIPARQFTSPYTAIRPHFTPRSLYSGKITHFGPSLPELPLPPGRRPPSLIQDRQYESFTELPRPQPPKAETDSAYMASYHIDTGEMAVRIPSREFSLKDELLTPEDFSETETARKRGIVFHDPNRPLHIRGIFPIPSFYTSSLPPEYLSSGIEGLVEGLRLYTDITPGVRIPIHLLRNVSLECPFAYISYGRQWEYLPLEAKVFGEYLRNGGFALFDNLTPWEEFSPAEMSMRQFIRDALGSGARFEPIPNDDPLYHCYFDFPDGPPIGSELQFTGGAEIPSLSKQRMYLEGVRIHGRLVAVFSNKGYGNVWLRRGEN